MFKSTVLVFFFFLSFHCFSQNEPQDLFLPLNYSNWVSVDYLNCLTTKLPCECEKKGEVFLLDLDTTSSYANLYYGESNQDYWSGYLESAETNSYYIIFNPTSNFYDTLGMVSVSGDTLSYFEKHGRETRFVKFGDYDFRSYLQGNISWINEQLKIRGYNDLQTILKAKYPHFFCNWELKGINLVYDGKKNWVLEIEGDELVIYKWVKPPKRKSIELVIKKKEIARLKW